MASADRRPAQQGRPVRIESACTLHVNRETAWDFIVDPRNWRHYWSGVEEAPIPSDDWPSVGATCDVNMVMLGVRRVLHTSVDQVVPGRMLMYYSNQPGLPDGLFELHFADLAPTESRYRVVVSLWPRTGVKGLYDRVMLTWSIKRDLRNAFERLAKALENAPQVP